MTIMITGARGTVGAALLRRLHARGHAVLAASRDPDTLDLPDELPRRRLDLADPDPFGHALTGVTRLFLYAEPAGIAALLRAAQHAGVHHVVLLSSSAVTAPDADTDPLAAFHLTVERALAATSLTATVLRPGAFATNALGWAPAIRSGHPVAQPYLDARMAPIHPQDIVDVAELALTSNNLAGQAITLGGPQSLSFREQLGIIAELLGHRVEIHEPSHEQAYQRMTQHMPEPIARSLLNHWSATPHHAPATDDTATRINRRPIPNLPRLGHRTPRGVHLHHAHHRPPAVTAFYHVCFVVPDLHAAMADLTAAAGCHWTTPRTDTLGSWDYQVAFTTDGPPFIELINGAVSSPWDPTNGARFDHLGYWTTSINAASQRLTNQGFTEAFSGCPYGRPFTGHHIASIGARFELFDTTAQPRFLAAVNPHAPPMPAIDEVVDDTGLGQAQSLGGEALSMERRP